MLVYHERLQKMRTEKERRERNKGKNTKKRMTDEKEHGRKSPNQPHKQTDKQARKQTSQKSRKNIQVGCKLHHDLLESFPAQWHSSSNETAKEEC